MKEVKKEISVKFYLFHQLSADDAILVSRAMKVRRNAYAPYSKYAVGATVLERSGKIFTGCNVECATFTQTSHAEQVAIAKMISEVGKIKIEAVCCVGAFSNLGIGLAKESPNIRFNHIEDACMPCGQCLQIIWEFCEDDPNVRLLGVTASGLISITSIGNVLPVRFGPADLGK